MKKIALVALLSAVVATPVMAAETGFYAAGDLGSVTTGYTSSMGFRVGGGFKIDKMFSVEGAYLKAADQTVGFGTTYSFSALQFAGVAAYPVAPSIDVIGKLGMSMNSAKATATGFGATASATASKTDVLFGIGGQYHVTPQINVRAQYENFGTSLSMMSVGATYAF